MERRSKIEGEVPTVFIPSLLRPFAGGRAEAPVAGSNVGEVIDNLLERYPELAGRLLEDGQLRGNLSIAIDGEIGTMGRLDRVEEDSEIHFIAAVSGG